MVRKGIIWAIAAGCLGVAAAVVAWFRAGPGREVVDVYPGESIQAALDSASLRPNRPLIRIHAGVYRPSAPGEALIHFNARHDGLTLEGVGAVILTAANPDIADLHNASFPAVVNHVVYFGDGVSEKTVLRHVTITGANGFVRGPPDLAPVKTGEDFNRADRYLAYASAIESNANLPKTSFFYTDGGGILVYGRRSYPTIEEVVIVGNRSSVCGGGASVQHHVIPIEGAVHFTHCVFRDNHAGASGGAMDLLTAGSAVVLDNCLFAGNVSDEKFVLPENTRFAALSVFPGCRAIVRNCTFADNWSGVDDRGDGTYEKTIFWKNVRPGGVSLKPPFDVNITDAAGVSGCMLGGSDGDLRSNVSRTDNRFDAPDPAFDENYRPHNPAFDGVGYRP